MTEPPALITAPDEGVSGLWLWHGAPPDQQKHQAVARRAALWPSIGAAVIVVALSALAVFVLIVPRYSEPAAHSALSPPTVAIDTPTSPPPPVDTPSSQPPAIDTPASPPAATNTPESNAAVADRAASAPASVATPAGILNGPPASDQAAQPPASRAPIPAPRGSSSQGSRSAAAKPGMDGRHNYPRVAKKAEPSLTDLLATPAFRNGTLRPGLDH
jgi:hypothetical protein